MDAIWHYNSSGGTVGPKTKDDLLGLLQQGIISEDTLIWTEDFGSTWRKLSDVPGMRPAGAPPPLPTTEVNSTWIWALALVPLLGYGVEKILADSYSDIPTAMTTAGYIAANCVFGYWDEQAVKRSGRKDQARGFLLAAVFAPAYLFIRRRLLKQNQLPLVVWILTLLFSVYADNGYRVPYLGLGIPSCNAGSSIAQVKEIFPRIPANLVSANAISVKNVKMVSTIDKVRTCTATVETSINTEVSVIYTIQERDDGYYYLVSLN